MNKEELRKLILNNSSQLPRESNEDILNEFETQIRLETLKEVLPLKYPLYDYPGELYPDGYNACIREILNNANNKWGIILVAKK